MGCYYKSLDAIRLCYCMHNFVCVIELKTNKYNHMYPITLYDQFVKITSIRLGKPLKQKIRDTALVHTAAVALITNISHR